MFLAQNMLFAKHIVKLVDIYGGSFFHSITIYEIKLYFKCGKYFDRRAHQLADVHLLWAP
jgi:hypothetical protein